MLSRVDAWPLFICWGITYENIAHLCVCGCGWSKPEKLSLWVFFFFPQENPSSPFHAEVNVRLMYFRPGMGTQTWQQQPVDIWHSLYFLTWITMFNDMVSYTRESIQPASAEGIASLTLICTCHVELTAVLLPLIPPLSLSLFFFWNKMHHLYCLSLQMLQVW